MGIVEIVLMLITAAAFGGVVTIMLFAQPLKTTRLHINAMTTIFFLFVIVVAAMVIEWQSKALGNILGEVIMLAVAGMVYCAKYFASQGHPNGDDKDHDE